MPKSWIRGFYAVGFLGTALHCLFWIEFSVPLLNWTWVVAVLLGGAIVEAKVTNRSIEAEFRWRRLHMVGCAVIAVYVMTLPGLHFLLGNRNTPSRPETAYGVSLLPLIPYGVVVPFITLARSAFAWVRRSWLQHLAAAALAMALLIPTAWMMMIMAIGMIMFGVGDRPVEEEEVVDSPLHILSARHEIRSGYGGAFADAFGNVWIEPPFLPIRQLACRYFCDDSPGGLPGNVMQWRGLWLEVRIPEEASGRRTGYPTLW